MPFEDIGTTKRLVTHKGRGSHAEDLSGRRFGRWMALGLSSRRQNLRTLWHCRCDCGSEREVLSVHLKRGKSVSCGCYGAEVTSALKRTHGQSGKKQTPEYKAWCQLINRCENPNGPDYRIYGARGISVCERWRNSFQNFLADMGARPTPRHSVDRRNGDGNYEPGNCCWATKKGAGKQHIPQPICGCPWRAHDPTAGRRPLRRQLRHREVALLSRATH